MGRREDGAAVRKGRRCAQNSSGRPSGETPPSADAAPRASGKRTSWHSGDGGAPLAGNTTCCQELADGRGWSTFRKRGPHIMRHAAVERRKAPLFFGREGTPSQSVPPDGLAGHPSGVSHTPASAGAPLPSRGSLRISKSHEGLPGADIRIRAMSHAWREAGRPAARMSSPCRGKRA